VVPPFVTLESTVVIPASCLTDAAPTAAALLCRTVVLAVRHDGFEPATAAMVFAVQQRVMRPGRAPGGMPFGLAAMWDLVGPRSTVTTNVTHLTVVLPRLAGLDVVRATPIEFVFGDGELLRHAAPPEGSPAVAVVVAPSPVAVPSNPVWVQTAAGFLAAAVALFPTDSPMLDAQLIVMTGMSPCIQPAARDAATLGRRLLFPSVLPSEPIATALLHNVVMVLAFAGVHTLCVACAMAKYRCAFEAASAKVMFPSLSVAVAMLLHPGIATASFRLMMAPDTPPAVTFGAVVAMLYSVALCAAPAVAMRLAGRRFFLAVTRSHEEAMHDFPLVVRLCLPSSSWGPNRYCFGWIAPYCGVETHGVRWCTVHGGTVIAVALLSSVWPSSPVVCAAPIVLLMAVSVGYAALVAYVRPYRFLTANVGAVVQSATYVLPLGVSLVHCFDVLDANGDVVANLFMLAQVAVILRCALLIVGLALELKVLRPTVWPDAFDGMMGGGRVDLARPVTVLSADELEAVFAERESHLRGAMVELRASDAAQRGRLAETRARRFLSEEELRAFHFGAAGAQRLVQQEGLETAVAGVFFAGDDAAAAAGGPDGAGRDPAELLRQAKRLRELRTLRHPVASLLRNDGPMPPVLREDLEREYSRL
jgi:hypothetical protein